MEMLLMLFVIAWLGYCIHFNHTKVFKVELTNKESKDENSRK